MVRTQFSLRMLLAAVAFAAANLGLWVSKTTWQTGLFTLLLFLATPAISLVVISNCKGYLRTFFVGVLVPSTCIAIAFVPFIFDQYMSMLRNAGSREQIAGILAYASVCKNPSVVLIGFAPVVGLLCVLTHWLFIRAPQNQSD